MTQIPLSHCRACPRALLIILPANRLSVPCKLLLECSSRELATYRSQLVLSPLRLSRYYIFTSDATQIFQRITVSKSSITTCCATYSLAGTERTDLFSAFMSEILTDIFSPAVTRPTSNINISSGPPNDMCIKLLFLQASRWGVPVAWKAPPSRCVSQ